MNLPSTSESCDYVVSHLDVNIDIFIIYREDNQKLFFQKVDLFIEICDYSLVCFQSGDL